MDILQATLLGVIQGLTEFLPISSSGHLVLVSYHFNLLPEDEALPLYIGIATNTGTLLAVLVALRRDVWDALSGFFVGLRQREARASQGWLMALLVIVGSVPTVLIGLGLREVFEVLNRPLYVSFALAATGVVMWFTPTSGPKKQASDLSFRDAFIGGIAQGIAVVPGVSRSGITIATMLWRGASNDLAPRFSFLMYLVVSFGVSIIGIEEVRASEIEVFPLVVMVLTSFVTGYVALIWMFAILRKGRFRWFAPYLWAVAAFTLVRIAVT
ncbi:MAG: undecaprenyl-diphosphate phosphatase [Trueperaceae bacterium]|nr:undecaprenyl-diphosphate phosphatase [Trueperaceae bacterium]